jgi:hypothetical protein
VARQGGASPQVVDEEHRNQDHGGRKQEGNDSRDFVTFAQPGKK